MNNGDSKKVFSSELENVVEKQKHSLNRTRRTNKRKTTMMQGVIFNEEKVIMSSESKPTMSLFDNIDYLRQNNDLPLNILADKLEVDKEQLRDFMTVNDILYLDEE